MINFIEQVADVFELPVDVFSKDTKFRELDDFSSMVGYCLLVMMEEEYGAKITVDEFMKCDTVEDLYNKCRGE